MVSESFTNQSTLYRRVGAREASAQACTQGLETEVGYLSIVYRDRGRISIYSVETEVGYLSIA